MTTDTELRDEAVKHLTQTTTGYLKSNGTAKPPPWPEGSAHWKTALDLLAEIGTAPEPEPPKPEPPPVGTVKRLDRLTDWSGIQNMFVRPAGGGWFAPTATSPPNTRWPNGGGVFQLGDGIRFVCTYAMDAPWSDKSKLAIGAWDMPSTTFTGKHQVWEWVMRFPKAGNPDGFPVASPWSAAVIAEWETSGGSVGDQLQLSPNGVLRWSIRQQNEHYPTSHFPAPAPLLYDQDIAIRYEVKWSGGSDGFRKADIGGVRVYDKTGPNLWGGEGIRHHSQGWYGARVATNEVVFLRSRVTTL